MGAVPRAGIGCPLIVVPVTGETGPEVFEERLDAWRAWQQSPWGRLRYEVVAATLRRTCAALGDPPLRVLDVGGGDGGDVLPLAEAGHDVTIVDYSEPLLVQARDAASARHVDARVSTVCADLDELPSLRLGGFDLVLCHNVVQYRDSAAGTVRLLAPAVRPGGALSLLAPNPPSEVLAAAIREEDLGKAAELLTATSTTTATFRHDVRRVPAEEVESALQDCGFADVSRFGIRAVTDYIQNDARKHEPDFYRQLAELELALCDREPFVRTARMWQLVARR